MKVTLTKNDAGEVLHKLGVLRDSPDLLEDYNLSEMLSEHLYQSVPRDGGEWDIPGWAIEAVKGEMQDHVVVLRDMANDARDGGEIGQALAMNRQANRLEKMFQ